MLEIMNDVKDCDQCHFRSESAFLLSDEELGMLKNGMVDVSVKKGEKIMVEGFPHTHVIYLKEGFAKLHVEGPTGKDQILKIATPCNYIGIQSLLADRVNSYSATAITDVKACYVNGPLFHDLINRNGSFAASLLTMICKEELVYFNNFVNLQQKNNRGRLADALIYFSEELFKNDEFELPFSYVDLAALIGATRESVNRILREFGKSRLVTFNKRHIAINNMDMLKKISEVG
jgi:CRP-like cAMP-binding protein